MRAFRASWKRLSNSNNASLMMRLAIIANDISTAGVLVELTRRQNENPTIKNSDPTLRKILEDYQLRTGFQMYALRMMIAHFCAGMKIIKILKKKEEAGDKEVCRYLAKLQPGTAKDYEFLKTMWVKGSTEEDLFTNRMKAVRDSLASHYDEGDEHITKTIASMAALDASSTTSFMHGSNSLISRFFVADSMICCTIADSIWGAISKDEEATYSKISEYLGWCGNQCLRLHRVAFELCAMYFSENSV